MMIAHCSAFIALFVVCVNSYSTGPPTFVCDDPELKPSHDGADFQDGPSPFALTITPKRTFIDVRITATSDILFKGYIIQAQYAEGPDAGFPVGSFEVELLKDSDEPVHKMFNCETEEEIANTIAHNFKAEKDQHKLVTAKWYPPQDLPLNTNVVFKATVVKVKPEFWRLEQVITV